MVFTESDVYMIVGYVAELWEVERSDEERAEDTELAITEVLRREES